MFLTIAGRGSTGCEHHRDAANPSRGGGSGGGSQRQHSEAAGAERAASRDSQKSRFLFELTISIDDSADFGEFFPGARTPQNPAQRPR